MPQLGTIRNVNVTLNIDHTYVGNLSVALRSPNTEISLVNGRGSQTANFFNTKFDSSCPTPIASGVAPFNGCFAPEVTLDGFNSIPSSIGPWALIVKDNAPNDAGRLVSWTLRVCGTP